jgi:hypothetical protein
MSEIHFIDPQGNVGSELKKPVTTLELSKFCTSFAGVDTRVRIDGMADGQIQAISFSRFKVDGEWHVAGTIIRLVLDEGCGRLPDKFNELQVVAANEYGQIAIVFGLKDVEIISCSSGISIDDIVMEEHYNYVAKEFIPGQRLTKEYFTNVKELKTVHTKHIEINDDQTKKEIFAEALKITKDEPLDFLTDLNKVLDRHGVML